MATRLFEFLKKIDFISKDAAISNQSSDIYLRLQCARDSRDEVTCLRVVVILECTIFSTSVENGLSTDFTTILRSIRTANISSCT